MAEVEQTVLMNHIPGLSDSSDIGHNNRIHSLTRIDSRWIESLRARGLLSFGTIDPPPMQPSFRAHSSLGTYRGPTHGSIVNSSPKFTRSSPRIESPLKTTNIHTSHTDLSQSDRGRGTDGTDTKSANFYPKEMRRYSMVIRDSANSKIPNENPTTQFKFNRRQSLPIGRRMKLVPKVEESSNDRTHSSSGAKKTVKEPIIGTEIASNGTLNRADQLKQTVHPTPSTAERMKNRTSKMYHTLDRTDSSRDNSGPWRSVQHVTIPGPPLSTTNDKNNNNNNDPPNSTQRKRISGTEERKPPFSPRLGADKPRRESTMPTLVQTKPTDVISSLPSPKMVTTLSTSKPRLSKIGTLESPLNPGNIAPLSPVVQRASYWGTQGQPFPYTTKPHHQVNPGQQPQLTHPQVIIRTLSARQDSPTSNTSVPPKGLYRSSTLDRPTPRYRWSMLGRANRIAMHQNDGNGGIQNQLDRRPITITTIPKVATSRAQSPHLSNGTSIQGRESRHTSAGIPKKRISSQSNTGTPKSASSSPRRKPAQVSFSLDKNLCIEYESTDSSISQGKQIVGYISSTGAAPGEGDCAQGQIRNTAWFKRCKGLDTYPGRQSTLLGSNECSPRLSGRNRTRPSLLAGYSSRLYPTQFRSFPSPASPPSSASSMDRTRGLSEEFEDTPYLISDTNSRVWSNSGGGGRFHPDTSTNYNLLTYGSENRSKFNVMHTHPMIQFPNAYYHSNELPTHERGDEGH